VLGTDGFGRSDTRANLRSFFEVDRYHITVAALYSLAQSGEFDAAKIDVAIAKYNINPNATAPWLI
jgi:pyruvate dehydrogenase E1 component